LSGSVDRTRDAQLARQAELDHQRRYADAEVAVARKARLSDGELVPLMRARLDAWCEWGDALGPPEPNVEAGRKGAQRVTDSHTLANAERKDRERARKIAAIRRKHAGRYREYRDHTQPDTLTLAGLLRFVRDRPPAEGRGHVEGTYRVIYADPPWSYGSKNLDRYGAAEAHYWTLSTPEICALAPNGTAVDDLAEDDAVLFLWATSPLLPDALEVIDAWGFTYKASFVWDKVKHNYGHYNSVRHELLLLGTKGSCLPDSPELHDSVVSIERTGHSGKPAYFRELIEKLYEQGSRLELFAREHPAGWDSWGSE